MSVGVRTAGVPAGSYERDLAIGIHHGRTTQRK